MAVAAALDALAGVDPKSIDALAFATTTAPYREKQSATTIAAALDLPAEIRTSETGGTLRCGTSALLGALDSAAAGRRVLVTAADCRLGAPSGANEQTFGDGAAAFVLGDQGVIANVLAQASLAREIVETWRDAGDPYVRNWEERFGLTQGYGPAVAAVAKQVLKDAGLDAKGIAKLVLAAPSEKVHGATAKSLGFAPDRVASLLVDRVGVVGCASAPMRLAGALETAKPGDRILVIDYGEGADALVIEVTDAVASFRPRQGLAKQIDARREIDYGAYLRWRESLEMEPPRRPDPRRPSAPAMFRNYGHNLGLKASRCLKCATVQFPPQRVCWKCKTRDEREPYALRDKPARLSTFTADNLTVSPDPPEISAVIDFEGGGRMIGNVTDTKLEDLRVG
ncbi:MAG: hypothetical protein KC466_12840, partial [Myxococcales bacterium]|nr:hypothetical protein [Myxococcales bacterium]